MRISLALIALGLVAAPVHARPVAVENSPATLPFIWLGSDASMQQFVRFGIEPSPAAPAWSLSKAIALAPRLNWIPRIALYDDVPWRFKKYASTDLGSGWKTGPSLGRAGRKNAIASMGISWAF